MRGSFGFMLALSFITVSALLLMPVESLKCYSCSNCNGVNDSTIVCTNPTDYCVTMTVKVGTKTSTTRSCANICPASSAAIKVEVCCQTDLCTQVTPASTESSSTAASDTTTSASTASASSGESEPSSASSTSSTTTTTTTTTTSTTTTTRCRNGSNKMAASFNTYIGFLLLLYRLS